MGADELLDEENLDPKKFFDETEYNTLLVNRDGFNKKQNDAADLMESLLEKNITRQTQEEIYSELKKGKAQKSLIEFIKTIKENEAKAKIISACWETCLDFDNDFLFFTELACDNDFLVAMEAFTVVENIEGQLSEEILTKALEIAQNSKSVNKVLVEDLINNIRRRI